MAKQNMKQTAQELLNLVNININGDKPWDIQVHNPKLYARVLAGGSLALGGSYMDGWWDCKDLDQFFFKLLNINMYDKFKNWNLIWNIVKAKFSNMQTKLRSKHVAEQHYDLGNDLYENMLDKRMVYSCGYWKNAKTLDKAQEAKLDIICKKVGLKNGMTVLDIGCGWGSFAKFAAEKYKVKVVGITISKEQAQFAIENCKGLPVEILIKDYRNMRGQFDAIISIGMFEHVGYKNYKTFMKVANRCLKNNGLFLLHSIASNMSVKVCDPWFDKYIFPHGMLPSIKQIGASIEGLFVMEDWHNFGADYDKTLYAWFINFDKNYSKLKAKYNTRFYRMWKYYILSLSGGFRARHNQLWQIVFSKNGMKGGYKSIR